MKYDIKKLAKGLRLILRFFIVWSFLFFFQLCSFQGCGPPLLILSYSVVGLVGLYVGDYVGSLVYGRLYDRAGRRILRDFAKFFIIYFVFVILALLPFLPLVVFPTPLINTLIFLIPPVYVGGWLADVLVSFVEKR